MSTAQVVSKALPTLLTSRPQLPHGCKDLVKKGGEAQPERKLPKAYAMPIRVHNTFIDTAAERSPSLERFYREREVSTCPSAHIGRFRELFQGAGAGVGVGWETDDETDTQLPSEAHETRSASEASPCNLGRAGPSRFLSLADALGPPPPPPYEPTLDGQQQLALETGFGDATASAAEVPCDSVFGDWCFSWGEAALASCAPAGGCFPDASYVSATEMPTSFVSATEMPCNGAYGDWHFSWVEALPPQCATASGASAEGVPAGACCPLGAADGMSIDGVWLPTVTGLEPPVVPEPPSRPAPGSEEMPSVGSAAHAAGGCKPCAFVHTVGCSSGLKCEFCHLCGPDERRRRRRAKMEVRRAEKSSQARKQESTPDSEDLEVDQDEKV